MAYRTKSSRSHKNKWIIFYSAYNQADMNSAYNQMPQEEQSRRLTHFVKGNQQYEFNRLFYGIFIGPAAFSAFMSCFF